MVKKYPIIKRVDLNNKSRKGSYIYLKLGKGKRGAYYKDKGEPLDKFLRAYYVGFKSKKKRTLLEKIPGVKSKRVPKIESLLRSGISKYKINNAQRLNVYGEKTAMRNLLLNKGKAGDGKALVRDLQLIDILVRDENVMKYKNRIEIMIEGRNGKGMPLFEASVVGNKTLNQVRKDLAEIIRMGMEITDAYARLANDLKAKGYLNYRHKNNGKIARYDITLVYRKAKRK